MSELEDQLQEAAEKWVRLEQRYEREFRFDKAVEAREKALPGLEAALNAFDRSLKVWTVADVLGSAAIVGAKKEYKAEVAVSRLELYR